MSTEKLKILDTFPSDLVASILPTNEDIIKAIYHQQNASNVPYKNCIEKVSQSIVEIWNRAQIPCVSLKSIEKKINDLFEKYRTLLKTDPSRHQLKFSVKVFKVSHKTIFYSTHFAEQTFKKTK